MARLPKRRVIPNQLGCWVGGILANDEVWRGEFVASTRELEKAAMDEGVDVSALVADMMNAVEWYDQWLETMRIEHGG